MSKGSGVLPWHKLLAQNIVYHESTLMMMSTGLGPDGLFEATLVNQGDGGNQDNRLGRRLSCGSRH